MHEGIWLRLMMIFIGQIWARRRGLILFKKYFLWNTNLMMKLEGFIKREGKGIAILLAKKRRNWTFCFLSMLKNIQNI